MGEIIQLLGSSAACETEAPVSSSAWLTTMSGQELFQEGNKSSFPSYQPVSQQLTLLWVLHIALMFT